MCSSTNQPTWKLVYASDCDALYIDETGVYPPEYAILDEINDAPPSARFEVSRIPLESLKIETSDFGRYGDQAITRLTRDWFVKSLPEVARSCGRSTMSLVRELLSDDARALASAYSDIAGYHGAFNFDQYPETWSEYEASDWPERKDPKTDPDAYADCLAGSDDAREDFVKGYISCALWCGVYGYRCTDHEDTSDCTATCNPEMVTHADLGGPEADESDLADDADTQLRADANAFFTSEIVDLLASTLDMEQAGHGFFLTRNRHGAGFWDRKSRGSDADAALDRLTVASHAYGECSLVADANGSISLM